MHGTDQGNSTEYISRYVVMVPVHTALSGEGVCSLETHAMEDEAWQLAVHGDHLAATS